MKFGENRTSFSEKKIFKDYEIIIHVYSPVARADNPGKQNFKLKCQPRVII